ncbi:response regulator [Heyndrickxia acidicola]|uniref:Response regulator n=1 Tax=Heyndrickxia acidicola TaxID=209389 RepID=A0ABU6MN74_9BACI|nr:response regulator [Heyndrickxia acidicola]MED1205431.1 response regulator [Heyndrickxia acidicola]
MSKKFNPLENIQVLIIDDDVRISEINRRFVEKIEGYTVIGIATNKQEAKEQLEVLCPDLVLLDIYFPDMSGLDFLRFIKEVQPDTDVIMITAAKEVRAVKNAIRSGVYDFIVKPVIFERFQTTLLNYKKFRNRLNKLAQENQKINQHEIDELFINTDASAFKRKDNYHFPKGIDQLTLEKVKAAAQEMNYGSSAEQIGSKIGISRTTARRYLEYLVSQGEVEATLSYGDVGRPERIYQSFNK